MPATATTINEILNSAFKIRMRAVGAGIFAFGNYANQVFRFFKREKGNGKNIPNNAINKLKSVNSSD